MTRSDFPLKPRATGPMSRPTGSDGGETTSLLTLTSGLVFGLLPNLFGIRAVHAAASGTAHNDIRQDENAPEGAATNPTSSQPAAAAALQDNHDASPAADHGQTESSLRAHADGNAGQDDSFARPDVFGANHGSNGLSGNAAEMHAASPVNPVAGSSTDTASHGQMAGSPMDQGTSGGIGAAASGVSHGIESVGQTLLSTPDSVAHAVGSIATATGELSHTLVEPSHAVASLSSTLSGALDPVASGLGSSLHAATTASDGLVHAVGHNVAGAAGTEAAGLATSTVATPVAIAAPISAEATHTAQDVSHLATSIVAPVANVTSANDHSVSSSAPAAPTADFGHSISMLGHALSSTNEGAPHVAPIIGQSYVDDVGAHDHTFNLHALHGL